MQSDEDEQSNAVAPSTLSRLVLVLVGVVWGMRSLQAFFEPNFTDPQKASDWWAVVSFSLALALLPVGIAVLLSLTHHNRISRVLLFVVTLAAITASIANLVEDGVGVDSAGNVYLASVGLMMLAMIALAGVLLVGRHWWPALIILATLIGLANLEIGGGVLVLVAWVAAALRAPRLT